MNKIKVYILTILLATLFSSNLIAQNSLSGKITDKAKNDALIGATIFIPDLKISAISKDDGTYNLDNIPNGTFVVEVSFIGFATQSKEIKINGLVSADFALEESSYPTKEVVVTGNSKAMERQHSPQPTTEVTNEFINENSSTNVMDAIATAPGVSGMTDGQSITKPVIRGLGYNRVLTIDRKSTRL